MPTRILFLYSDTGGGHRSAAEAIRDAVYATWPGRADIALADFYLEAYPPLLNRTGSLYTPIINHADWIWRALFKLGDMPGQTDRVWRVFLPLMKGRFIRLLQKHSPDLVVSVHPLCNRPMVAAARALPRPIPAITVVTDLVLGSAFWYDRHVDFIYVPTETARLRALREGVAPGRVEVVGQPVHPRFQPFHGDRAALRQSLGLVPDRPAVLIVGGGEGMGKVYETARAIAASGLPVQLVVVAGRNRQLKARLEARRWEVPTIITGFVNNMPDWMAAVDVLVTKAGPGTISEALIAGLPMLLFGYIPGQEASNVTWVTEQGVGAAAFTPDAIVAQLREWLAPGSDALAEMIHRALTLARPTAARDLGERLLHWAEQGLEASMNHKGHKGTKRIK
ncbi:MAG: galactosyldiacylglycerol synthase [Anaerolineae bacterium]|nr:galactosyldiacylglycerol synthase [Anaerolineae bacterium]